MPAYAALLRGINVGGHNKVAMADLRALCGELGLGDVTTYIQSGNVVFSSARTDAGVLAGELEGAIAGAFGFGVPVVVRSAADLDAVAASNPFVRRGRDPSVLSVGFLSDLPAPDAVRALRADPLASPPGGDEFELVGQEVFLHHPNGYGRSKLTNSYFDRRLGTMMTVRNWRTVVTLGEMTQRLGM